MKYILRESKRDNFLLPYLELLNSNGINVSLAELKTALLRKLSTEAGMQNLSARSNYYLAGASRYYFNGDLTTNKPVSLLTKEYWNGNQTNDEWNNDVCKRLNALILILRNAYIDSVGTTFEQPEDFGKLSLKQLFRKYGKKIDKELGIKSNEEEEVKIDTNKNVGNGYTFDIMYSFNDCKKYNTATSPGAWCITYGQNHYNYYVKHLNIHYVIFRMNGWEKVERPEDPRKSPGWSPEKPHDLYGNSLIALLQSNNSPEPVYITSRWNHGYEASCEADHAYTKEEFQQITGVTDEDLRRIYDIWKMNENSNKSGALKAKQTKTENLGALRAYKYAQMRINSGESPESLLTFQETFVSRGKQSKSISLVTLKDETNNKPALFDNGKLVLETVGMVNYVRFEEGSPNLLICNMSRYHILYNMASHSIISIDGIYKFKHAFTGTSWTTEDNKSGLYTIKQTSQEIAFIDSTTLKPLQLPNGEYWFNFFIATNTQTGSPCECQLISYEDNDYIQIVYDLSSFEMYWYNIANKTFVKSPDRTPEVKDENLVPLLECDYSRNFTDSHSIYQLIRFVPKNRFEYASNYYLANYQAVIYRDWKPINLYIKDVDKEIRPIKAQRILKISDHLYIFSESYYGAPCYVFDSNTNKQLSLFGFGIYVSSKSDCTHFTGNFEHILSFEVEDPDVLAGNQVVFVYDEEADSFYCKKGRNGSKLSDYAFEYPHMTQDESLGSEVPFFHSSWDWWRRKEDRIPLDQVGYLKPNNTIDKQTVNSIVNEVVNRIISKILIP